MHRRRSNIVGHLHLRIASGVSAGLQQVQRDLDTGAVTVRFDAGGLDFNTTHDAHLHLSVHFSFSHRRHQSAYASRRSLPDSSLLYACLSGTDLLSTSLMQIERCLQHDNKG